MNYSVKPSLDKIKNTNFKNVGGISGERLAALENGWLLRGFADNPSMIQKFIDRRFENYHDLLPWNGEFPGKFMTGAAYAYELTGNEELKKTMLDLAYKYIDTIDTDGYGGCMPDSKRLWGWDAWNMYHCVLGLYRWYLLTGDEHLWDGIVRVSDYLVRTYTETGKDIKTVYATGGLEMNQAGIHIMAIMYAETSDKKYLDAALTVLEDFSMPGGGDYFNKALEGVEFCNMPLPRWESLHPIQGLAELYFITGEEKYKRAFTHIWKSIEKTDRHNTGGFSTEEQAAGDPFKYGIIETCCTIAWVALTVDYLRMTGDSKAADELEISYYNGVMGYQHPAGHWYTYNTPVNGERKSSYHDIVFQARAAAPDLNCCSVNAARGISSIADWAVMTSENRIYLNFYGGFEADFDLNGVPVSIKVKSDYPKSGNVKISASSEKEVDLMLRIPAWSDNTKVIYNGRVSTPSKGEYFKVCVSGVSNIELDLDMSLWAIEGKNDAAGKVSLYSGPILLTYDDKYNAKRSDVMDFQIENLLEKPVDMKAFEKKYLSPLPFVVKAFPGTDGDIILTDFATAGMSGTKYASWIKVKELNARKNVLPFEVVK